MPANFDLNALLQDPQVTAILRIALAGLVAGLIGLERELAGKAAGIRTYGLVGVGAAMFTVAAIYGFGSLDYASRIVGGVITGIGFLGAGAILHTRVHIVGLTTAAGLWVAAGVGLAILLVFGIASYIVWDTLLRPAFLTKETRYLITNKRVLIQRGVEELHVDRDKIVDVISKPFSLPDIRKAVALALAA